jgi:hypothetical protein
MSLLTIANEVADVTKGPRPVTIAGNTDPAAQNVLAIINRVGNRLMLAYAWNILRKEHTFTASGNETALTAANMPSDFDRFIPETFWDRDTNNLLSGPVSPVEWNGLKVQTFSSQNKKFIFRGGAVLTAPVFSSGVNLAFEYVSKNWCDVAAGTTPKAAFTIDTDIGIINEGLIAYGAIFEWLAAEGQPTQMAAALFKDRFDTLANNDAATADILVTADIFSQNSRHFEGAPKASRASYGGDF